MSRKAWSIVFDAAVSGYDELLFSSGDCTLWLIVKKEQLAGTLDGSQSQYRYLYSLYNFPQI